jgi:Rrf2 family transcriptional regulator, iron-sulfur cluster assembly transcription factor
MRITQEADYGFRVILYLSKLGYGEKSSAKTISREQGIPLRFLLKLLRKLTCSGIIKSYRGVNGGYALTEFLKT